MIDLSTTYLGLPLANPLMVGASPLADSLDMARRLEDAGASAIVMRSLFEEQITRAELGALGDVAGLDNGAADALAYFPRAGEFTLRPDTYLEHLRRLKAAIRIPVIASLNGTTAERWLLRAKRLEEAGADAVELNFYHVATNPRECGLDVERRLLDIAGALRRDLTIPMAVKLSPFFSSLSNLAQALEHLGVNGLVLFNRFYQADIDPEMMRAVPTLRLSQPEDLLLRVRWLAILSGQVTTSLAASGGVLTSRDAIKTVIAGADAVQLVTALLKFGPKYLAAMRRELSHWLEQREYSSLREVKGAVSLLRSPNAEDFERGSYLTALHTWQL